MRISCLNCLYVNDDNFNTISVDMVKGNTCNFINQIQIRPIYLNIYCSTSFDTFLRYHNLWELCSFQICSKIIKVTHFIPQNRQCVQNPSLCLYWLHSISAKFLPHQDHSIGMWYRIATTKKIQDQQSKGWRTLCFTERCQPIG